MKTDNPPGIIEEATASHTTKAPGIPKHLAQSTEFTKVVDVKSMKVRDLESKPPETTTTNPS